MNNNPFEPQPQTMIVGKAFVTRVPQSLPAEQRSKEYYTFSFGADPESELIEFRDKALTAYALAHKDKQGATMREVLTWLESQLNEAIKIEGKQ